MRVRKIKILGLEITIRDILVWIIFFIVYLFTSQLSRILFSFVSPSSSPSTAVLLTPVGIALASLLIYGYQFWSVIAVATILGSLIFSSTPIFIILIGATGNVLQALAGVYVLKKLKFKNSASRLRDILSIVFVGIFITTISPTFTVLGSRLLGLTSRVSWGSIWVAGILSVLMLTTFLLRWLPNKNFRKNGPAHVEVTSVLGLLILINYLIFWTTHATFFGVSIVLVQLALLFWIALRMGTTRITLAMLLTTIIGLTGIFFGVMHPTGSALSTKIYSTELYMIIFGILFYVITAVSEERDLANESLQKNIQELELALNKIRDDDKSKNDFISVLAHELRNPLAPIVSYLELLKANGINDPEAMSYIQTIDNNIYNMIYILDDLLDIARISNNKLTLRRTILNLQELVHRCIKTVVPLAEAGNHELALQIPYEPIFVYADRTRLEQIIINLLSNAIKYSPTGGRIDIILKANDCIRITIKDIGIGIRPEILNQIFEPFIQGDRRLSNLTGLGLGLSLSKKLIELQGGKIHATSEGSGRGSTFIVELPKLNPEEIQKLTNDSKLDTNHSIFRIERRQAKKLNILIVDDNKDAANSLKKLLEFKGYSVEVVYDGQDALDSTQRFSPDVIFLDIGLPNMDGYEVAKRLRFIINPSVILIALTGYGQREDKLKSEEAGFDYHLTKPTNITEIQKILDTLS